MKTIAENLQILKDSTDDIRKVGTEEVYAEAVDIENANFEYEETDKVIEKIEDVKNYDYKSGYPEKLTFDIKI